MSFEQFSLSEPRLKAIQDADTSGAPVPTPVQAALIPLMLTGKDVLVSAPAGSGKAAAYAIPALDLLQQDGEAATQVPGRARACWFWYRPAKWHCRCWMPSAPMVAMMPIIRLPSMAESACIRKCRLCNVAWIF